MINMFERKSVFIEYLGDYPLIRILDFLIEDHIFDYSQKDIAKNSGVAWNTFKKIFDRLVEKELVVKTRRVGKSDMSQINKENVVIQKLLEINKALMLGVLEKAEVVKA